jgi:disulfide bond formation protein DsbB
MLARREFPPAFIFVVGLATILGAWGFQLLGHYVPCKLCLEERWSYYIGLPIALITLSLSMPTITVPDWIRRALLVVIALIFAYGAWLGTYHAGAEWGWWPGPTDCGGGMQGASGQDLLNQLKDIRVVSCTDAAFRFPPASWGLSFAGWNAAISAVLVLVALWGAARKA